MKQDMSFTHGYGSIVGAFVGDAAGAPLEFASRLDPEKIENAMSMRGGGVLDIGPGQITDDSEMAMCQVQVLSMYKPQNFHHIAQLLLDKYREWFHSQPFDIGKTTIKAVGRYQQLELDQHLQRVAKTNATSKANGALMRITPLAVWTRHLDTLQDKIEMISYDTKLTHPNKSCIEASVAYCLAIHALIERPGDVDYCLQQVEVYLKDLQNSEVRSWIMEDSHRTLESISVDISIGFVRWAITLAFHHLRQERDYEEAIRLTLAKGGDTDTNAAIVGGLIGALHGVEAIPEYMKTPVIHYSYDPGSRIGYDRPEFLSPNQLEDQVRKLFEISE